jgi:hypothetical protein
METALSNLTKLPANKAEIRTFSERAKVELLSGNYDVLEIFVQSKAIEKTLEGIFKDDEVKTKLNEVASLYPEKTFEIRQAKITRSERKTYDHTSDLEWLSINQDIEILKARLKMREAILIHDDIDYQTGEVKRNASPFKTTEILSVSF